MARWLGAFALCLWVAGGCSRSAPAPAEVAAAPASALAGASSKAAGGIRVDSLELGDGFDEQTVTLDGVGTVFHPETQAIYAVGRISGVPAPGRLTGRWEHLDSGVRLAEVEQTFGEGDLEFWFSVTRPTAGWPEGHYKFYLAVNGEDVVGAAFEVTQDTAREEH